MNANIENQWTGSAGHSSSSKHWHQRRPCLSTAVAGAGASKLNLVSCFGQTTFPARSGTKNGQNRTNLEHTLAAYLGGELGHSTGCLEGFVGLENVEPAGKQLCQGVNR